MSITLIDWAIILLYVIFSLGTGIYFARRAGKGPEEYFLSGRSLPWWIVGTSMVATTFAGDNRVCKGPRDLAKLVLVEFAFVRIIGCPTVFTSLEKGKGPHGQ